MDLMRMQAWAYPPHIPDNIQPFCDLLHNYSQITQDDVHSHLLRIREEAWAVARFPCIGRWKFLYLYDGREPIYQQVVFRLTLPRSRDCLLDLGSCLGQALRQLRADGVNGSQLFAVDLKPKLFDVGFSLFRDHATLGATFVAGDMIDPDDSRLGVLQGKVTIVHATSFFHLFTWSQQLYIGRRLVAFLKPGTRNALIYGRHVGVAKPHDPSHDSDAPYLHDEQSFQQLWDEVGKLTQTRWLVQFQEQGASGEALLDSDADKLLMAFTVYQVS